MAKDPLQQQIDQAKAAQAAAKQAAAAGQRLDTHIAGLSQSLPGFEETINRASRDQAAAQDEADRERAAARAYTKNPSLAQQHLNAANAAQKKADAAADKARRARETYDSVKAQLDSYNFANQAVADTAERQAKRPGAGTPAVGSAAPAPAPAAAPPAAPAVPSDPRALQQYLNTLGAGLKVDGIIGAKTQAAAAKYGVTIPAAAAPVQQAPAVSQSQGNSSQQGPIVTDTTPRPAALTVDDIRAHYGAYGAILDLPDVAELIRRRAADPSMSDEQFLAALYQTPTWTTHETAELNWLKIKPADQQAEIAQQKTAIAAQARTTGVPIADDRLTQIATDSLRLGWSAATLNQAIAAEFHYKPGGQEGGIAQAEASLKAMAQQYGVAKYLDDTTLASFESQIAAGTATADTFRQHFVSLAQSVYPGIAEQITVTNPTSNALTPYRTLIANELGQAPDAVDFTDPKYSRFVNQIDDKGQHRPMSLYDAQTTIRSDPAYGWGYTKNGQDAAYQFQHSFLTAIGKVPGG